MFNDNYSELEISKIIDDGVIPKNASYANALLSNPCLKTNKLFIGVNQYHNDLIDPKILAEKINHFL